MTDIADLGDQPLPYPSIPEFPGKFESFPKIARYSRACVVTEKIDGTNAQIYISDDGTKIQAGSRSRWIYPGDDNYGFARWVEDNKEELLKLGPGRHFGEWWGAGIQRKYGLKEKRFSLFNSGRWGDRSETPRPACCSVVPVLWSGNLEAMNIVEIMNELRAKGSTAAPGFMDPEGVVIYHVASNTMFKKLLVGDELPKSLQETP